MTQQSQIQISTSGQGLYLITPQISNWIKTLNYEKGLLNIFLQHTSASLILHENADPTAKMDVETFFNQLVPENLSWYQHTLEGPDDMPAHLKSILTTSFLQIPITNSYLNLGTWQGIFLFEHRKHPQDRQVLLTALT